MQKIDVEKLNAEIEDFTRERDWDQFHSVKNLTMALSVEASELMEIFQWMKEEDSNALKDNPEVLRKVRDELADVFYYLLRIARKTDIDLGSALTEKMRKNREKYPADKVRGSSKKYSDY